jgi:UDP-GlcNAc:undecaprenyl-phosphate GlcNAc-1-phosphate transferase
MLVAFFLAAALAFALVPLTIRLAWAVGYLDRPEARKEHLAATALLGGAAVFAASLGAWLATSPGTPVSSEHWGAGACLAGGLVALLLGLWDDRFGMQPATKLTGQALAAGILLAGGATPELGLPAGVSAALSLVALVALMNAVNFIDNMNGMVGGLSAILLLGFASASVAAGADGLALAQLALAGACVGFLPHNFPRAKIFLGDAGSLLLGYSLGASALLAMQAAPPGWGRLGPLLMLAYPAFDLVFVVVTRLRDGRAVYTGGQDHANHRLATLLQSRSRTVLAVWVAGAASCGSGLAVLHANLMLPALLAAAFWVSLLVGCGLRLAAVPVVRRA